MKVAGMTSQSEAYIVDNERAIRINEYLKIIDPSQGALLCETIETHTYNRFMPLDPDSDMADKRVMESLKELGYDLDNERIYIAKVRLLNEAPYPIETGSDVVVPTFEEVKSVLISTSTDKGLVIGAIKNTDNLYAGADEELKNLFTTYEDGKAVDQFELPMIFDLWAMKDYPHVGVFGGSGSGKSYGLRVILEELMRHNIPTIISDPHNEMTFESEDGRFDDAYQVYEVGVNAGVDFRDLTAFDLVYLLQSAGGLTEPMKAAIENIKEQNESIDSFKLKISSMIELLQIGDENKIAQEIQDLRSAGNIAETNTLDTKLASYGKYIKTSNINVLKGISWRLTSLDKTGIFDTASSNVIEGLKSGKTVVIQGSKRVLTVFTAFILKKTYNARRDYLDAKVKSEAAYFPPFVSVIDEAHNFAPRGDESPSKSIIREIAQEGRKYGVFLVLATQRPSILDDTSTAQLNTKLLFRTTRETDIKTIRDETDISSEEAKRLPYLKSGNVFFSSATIGRTLFVRVRQAISHQPKSENPFDELRAHREKTTDKIIGVLKSYSPINETDYLRLIEELEDLGLSYTTDSLKSELNRLVQAGSFEMEETVFGRRYTWKN